MDRRDFIRASAAVAAASITRPLLAESTSERQPVFVETRQSIGALPHVWEECAGSDRAAITLRERWRQDLDRWRKEIGLKRVRFHGIFADELGVFAPSILNRAKVTPNFQNVFEVYDGLIERGVAPYVEVGFMPKQLASGARTFGFYNANVSPPTSLEAWSAFITTFIRGLADRYGIAAVRDWPFEIWNEPDLPFFWSGTQQQYFDLYKATATAIKSVDSTIKVGGPATSGGKWIGDFANYCAQNNAPIDFFATHAYAGGNQEALYGKGAKYSVNDVIPDSVAKVRATIEASSFAGRPLWLSEWSSDSPAMIAEVISRCLPNLQAMSHWVLSGTYEELGVADYVLKEGDAGWATLFRGIARPSFNTYKLLHALGNEQLAGQGPVLAARGEGDKISALVWNLAEAQQPAGIPGATAERSVSGIAKRFDVHFSGQHAGKRAHVSFVDQERGSPMPAWRAMGSPKYPTPAQVAELRRAADIVPATTMRLDKSSTLTFDLPPEGVALIELG
jgi:xylan 1,4-beta-xylosidase